MDKQKILHQIQRLQLPDDYLHLVQNYYVALAEHLATCQVDGRTCIVGIQGLQGTGKSTLAIFLKMLLEDVHSLRIATLSLDDFYLTRSQRQQLASNIHPLLITRGVPGTHDTEQLIKVLNAVQGGYPCQIPVFNKAIDDREPHERWNLLDGRVDMLLFDGWCIGCTPQPASALVIPVNDLERNEDAQGVWRRYVNSRLDDYRQHVFTHIDKLIVLAAPDFASVFQWRLLQEDKLRHTLATGGSGQCMNAQQIGRFIQHYERISRHALASLPESADVLINLDHHHRIESIDYR